ncbi:hypothetical protein [Anaerobacillus sp. 1_MG-2023]|uniref:DUF6944 family repetitive protein n=1 Tax=Anaerobacillus sp. 1_MG-2023 TaxID=3062655 RepID=UPI0026E1F6B3|nr:hypothetical protein [Anaerobacillus sp. 1_MG-2023]MDO6656810.1 hypothetical protein [Anaerobacillus sp. 1_MG-2023]
MEVYGEFLILSGAWIQTIGAAIASIGNTIVAANEADSLMENIGGDLYVIGNSVEATGNSLQAIGRSSLTSNENETFGTLGAWLQSAGNIANVLGGSGIVMGTNEEALNIDIMGDIIQSAGAAFEAKSSSISEAFYAELITTGQTIQSFAVAIEAIGLLYVKNGNKKMGQQILAIGSYGQTAGAAIAAIGFTKEFYEH